MDSDKTYAAGARLGLGVREMVAGIVAGVCNLALAVFGFVFGLWEGLVTPDVAERTLHYQKEHADRK